MSEATKDTFYGGMSKSRSEMKPVARLLRYIGTDPYPARLVAEGRVIARSYSEIEDGTYPETWEKGSELYTADQLKAAKIEVLREAASKTFCNDARYMLLGMADELERK